MFATFQTNLLCISSEKQIAFLCLLPHSIRTFISSMPCLLDFNEANQVKIVWQRINFFFARTHFFIFLQNDMTYLFPLLEIHTLLKKSAGMGCPTRHLSSWKFERFFVWAGEWVKYIYFRIFFIYPIFCILQLAAC